MKGQGRTYDKVVLPAPAIPQSEVVRNFLPQESMKDKDRKKAHNMCEVWLIY